MSTETHIAALKRKHELLEEKIEDLEKRPISDDTEIHRLKKEKLKIKDELARIGNC